MAMLKTPKVKLQWQRTVALVRPYCKKWKVKSISCICLMIFEMFTTAVNMKQNGRLNGWTDLQRPTERDTHRVFFIQCACGKHPDFLYVLYEWQRQWQQEQEQQRRQSLVMMTMMTEEILWCSTYTMFCFVVLDCAVVDTDLKWHATY